MKSTAVLVSILLLAGCSSDKTLRSSDGTVSTPSPTESVAATDAPSRTDPQTSQADTTSAPTATSTTAAPSTEASTPSTVGPPSEWREVDPMTIDLPLAVPCCGGDWMGVPSPALPAPGAPLSDGLYAVDGTWQANPADPIPLRVHRFEACSKIPDRCEGGEPYDDTAMGVDTSSTYALTMALDAELRVIYSGFRSKPDGEFVNATSVGDGTNLAALASAVDRAYEQRIASRVRSGENANDVFADVANNPGDGFSAAPLFAGTLLFEHDNAPPVLFQAPVDRGADILGLVVLSITDGKPTLVVYAGFYS